MTATVYMMEVRLMRQEARIRELEAALRETLEWARRDERERAKELRRLLP
jgi:hypothetical protein